MFDDGRRIHNNITNKISLKLQSCDLDFNTSISLLKSLKSFVESMCDNFDNYEVLGKQKSNCEEYEQKQKRLRRQNVRLNPLDYAKDENVQLTGAEKFRVECYIPVIDQIVASLIQRIAAYEKTVSYFGFLRNLPNLSFQEVRKHASKVIELYKDDLEESLITELIQFKEFIKDFITNNEKNEDTKLYFEAKMFKLIVEKDLQDIFPNICILLKIYLVLMTTNSTSERSFSKLKLINRLRASMLQDRPTVFLL